MMKTDAVGTFLKEEDLNKEEYRRRVEYAKNKKEVKKKEDVKEEEEVNKEEDVHVEEYVQKEGKLKKEEDNKKGENIRIEEETKNEKDVREEEGVNLRKSKQENCFEDFLNFNRYSVLEIEYIDEKLGMDEIDEAFKTSHPVALKRGKKKIREVKKKKNNRMEKTLLEFESPLIEVPFVRRCKSCFYSHFPNKKFCHWSMLRKDISLINYENEVSLHKANLLRNCISQQKTHSSQLILQDKSRRLRCGAGQERCGISLLVDRAIKSARKQ